MMQNQNRGPRLPRSDANLLIPQLPHNNLQTPSPLIGAHRTHPFSALSSIFYKMNPKCFEYIASNRRKLAWSPFIYRTFDLLLALRFFIFSILTPLSSTRDYTLLLWMSTHSACRSWSLFESKPCLQRTPDAPRVTTPHRMSGRLYYFCLSFF
jgi:hypothetical protein